MFLNFDISTKYIILNIFLFKMDIIKQEDEIYFDKLGVSYSFLSALGTIPKDSPMMKTSKKAPRRLMKHQRILLYEMNKRESTDDTAPQWTQDHAYHCGGNIGILMEEIGSGKSDVILNLISHSPSLKRDRIVFSNKVSIKKFFTYINISFQNKITDTGSLNWIVVPHGLIYQWRDLMKLFKIKSHVISTRKHFEDLDKHIDDDVWLISSTRYTELCVKYKNEYKNKMLARIIYDECDSIIIPGCVRVPAVWYWFVTSSAQNIKKGTVRSREFIQEVFQDIKDILPQIILKCDYKLVEECLHLPDPEYRVLKIKENLVRNVLNDVVGKNVRDMLNAEDYSGIAKYYNFQIVQNPQELLKRLVGGLRKLLLDPEQPTQSIEKQIRTIELRMLDQDECNICLEEVENITYSSVLVCCHSLYCFSCIMTHISEKKICPKCKKEGITKK